MIMPMSHPTEIEALDRRDVQRLSAGSDLDLNGPKEMLEQTVHRWKTWWKLRERDIPVGTISSSKTSRRRIPVPDFSLPDLSGDKVRLSPLTGKAVLVPFWDIGKTNCLTETATLNELHRQHSDRLAVLAISLDTIADERGCAHRHDHSAHQTLNLPVAQSVASHVLPPHCAFLL